MSFSEDLQLNNGKGIEATIKSIAEEELEKVQDTIEESLRDMVESTCELNQVEAEKVFGELSKLVTPQSLRSLDEMRPPVFGLDEEMAEYLVSNRVNALWECYINGEHEVVAQALRGKGGYYFNEIKRRFTAEIKAVEVPCVSLTAGHSSMTLARHANLILCSAGRHGRSSRSNG